MPRVTEMTDRDILLTLATMAVRDPSMCADDVIETLRALNRAEIVAEAEELAADDGIDVLEDDPEPDDELEADADEG